MFQCPKILREWVEVHTSRASGPGGQGVNKSESKVEVKLNLAKANWIPWSIKDRVYQKLLPQLSEEGDLKVSSQISRSQSENLEICLEKIRTLIQEAAKIPKVRRATKPTRSSQRKRVDSKKKHSTTKKSRQMKHFDD